MKVSNLFFRIIIILMTSLIFSKVFAKDPVILTGTLTLVDTFYMVGSGTAHNFSYDEGTSHVEGVIVVPPATITGPYPVVVASHGKGSDAYGLPLDLARDWLIDAGYAVIAVNYTHAGELSCTPDNTANPPYLPECGGSVENVWRLQAAINIMQSQSLIDQLGSIINRDLASALNRDVTFLYGNSMGAFVSIEAAMVLGRDITAVATTAGGIYGDYTPSGSGAVRNVYAPFLILHARDDRTVPASADESLITALINNEKMYQAVWYKTGGHGIARNEATIESFVLEWFNIMRDSTSQPNINSVTVTSDNTGVEVRGRKFTDNAKGGGVLRFKNAASRFVSIPALWADDIIRGSVPAGVADSGYMEIILPVGPYTDAVIEQPVVGDTYGNKYGGVRSNSRKYNKNIIQ